MKSLHDRLPQSKDIQGWSPMEFGRPLQEQPSNGIKNGEAVALFNTDQEIHGGNGSSSRVIKSVKDLVLSTWQPGGFAQEPRTDTDNKPGWQSAIKYPVPTFPREAAEQMIIDAKMEAEKIVRNAMQSAKDIEEHAYQDGWNNAMGEIRDRIVAASSLVQEISAWRENLMSQSEIMILDLVRTIAQKLFGTGYELDRDSLQGTFNKVLENARSLGNLRIYVNPEDASNLGPYWREFQESITTHTIEIIPSNSIARGGCYVNGQWGSADGRIETQLKSIMDTFDSESAVVDN